jgi:type IV pilus assembly protein PilN
MIKINLLPREERIRRKPLDTTFIFLAVFAIVMAAAMGWGWFWLNGEVNRVQGDIAQTQADLRKFDELAKQVERFRGEKQKLQDKINVIETLVAAQSGPVRVLDEVSKALPNDVWLTAFNRTGRRLELSGIAFSPFQVADFMKALGTAGDLLQSVDLVISESTKVEEVPVQRFTITADLREGKA